MMERAPLPMIDLDAVPPGPVAADPFAPHEKIPLVNAGTDTELARAFLYSNALSPHSLKSTKKDLGRFLLWCQQRRKTLTALRIEDLNDYKAFLRDPQPHADWICTTKWPRSDPRWRPFAGPLAPVSANHAFRVVKALLEFAKDAGYLSRNAGALVKNVKTGREARITRYLGQPAVECIHAALAALPATTLAARREKARDQFLFHLYLGTGARLGEVTNATMGAVYTEGDERWWLDVLGKGSRKRRLPVPRDLLALYRRYRAEYGLPEDATRDDPTPLVLATRGSALAGVTDEAVSKAMKRLFAAAAVIADTQGGADTALALRSASAHWLRHTMLSTHANNDISLKVLQDTAGHASIATTAIYLHKDDVERHDAITASHTKTRLANPADG